MHITHSNISEGVFIETKMKKNDDRKKNPLLRLRTKSYNPPPRLQTECISLHRKCCAGTARSGLAQNTLNFGWFVHLKKKKKNRGLHDRWLLHCVEMQAK